ncbi:MAG: hypothetical protein GC204_14525 [Chloroflexi bacterium]|nr:hypothetical protein [Chloroflexota bacterium]
MKTLVALYNDPHTAQQVLEALLEAGFSGDDISLIVKDAKGAEESEAFTATDGAGLGALVGALVGIGSALVPGIGPLIGSGPVAVAVTAGIGAAAGALTGGLSANLLPLDLSDAAGTLYSSGLRGGGTIVSVTSNEEWLEWAQRIMARYQPVKIEERDARWYTGGWHAPQHEEIPVMATETNLPELGSSRSIKHPSSSTSIRPISRVHIYDN